MGDAAVRAVPPPPLRPVGLEEMKLLTIIVTTVGNCHKIGPKIGVCKQQQRRSACWRVLPRASLTPAAAATVAAAAIVLKPSSSHENYVFMCDAEKSIPKSENLIIL